MNQKKIGQLLKELRKERAMTQEQLAEILGVTNRSISRWENGVNMPDLDLLIEISHYFEVSVEEILDGERKTVMMEKEQEETLLKIADYSNQEKLILSKRIRSIFIAGFIAFIIYMVLDMNGLTSIELYENIASFMLGIVFAVLLLGILYTSKHMSKIREFKMRLLKRNQS